MSDDAVPPTPKLDPESLAIGSSPRAPSGFGAA